jgi:hypothetical protein
MKTANVWRSVLVIAVAAAGALSADAGIFSRHRGCRVATCCECMPPEMERAMRQTVARLTTRVVNLQQLIDAQSDTEISPAAKATLRRQISLIGFPATVAFEPAVGENADLGQILTQDSVRTVGGEIADIRQNLRRLQGLPPD